MRMGAHIHPLPGRKLGRPGLVKENERLHHLPPGGGQGAADLKAANVAGARHDQGFDGIKPNVIRATRFKAWVPAHCMPLLFVENVAQR